jgi:hypothetical protein
MEHAIINRLMRFMKPLSIELKLEIISRITESLKVDLDKKQSSKESLLEELFGAWRNSDQNLSSDIIASRTTSSRDVSFE